VGPLFGQLEKFIHDDNALPDILRAGTD